MQLKSNLDKLLASCADMSLKKRAEMIINELELKNGDKVLEIGCGAGFYLYLLSSLGLRLTLVGVDIDPKGLATAKHYLKGKYVKLLKGDVMKRLPFNTGNFDKVFMSEVLEHLSNDKKGLLETKRVLKKNGILVITVPNYYFPVLWDPVNWFLQNVFGRHIKSGFWAGIWNQHLRLYKPKEVVEVVRKSGYRVIKTETLTFWSLPFNHYLLNYAARLLDQNKFPSKLADSINKFKTVPQKPFYVSFAFWVLRSVDRLNNIWKPNHSGVCVFLKAQK